MTPLLSAALLAMLLAAELPQEPPAVVRSVYGVAWFRGQPDFSIDIPGAIPDGADEELYSRLFSEAYCLGRPDQLPPQVGAATGDEGYRALLDRAEKRLRELAAEARPHYTSDSDYTLDQVSQLGWSKALEEELASALVDELVRLGVYDQLWNAYQEHRGDPQSCQSRFYTFNLEWRAQQQDIPGPDQWRHMINLCGGPPDDIGGHIVYHLDDPDVDPDRRRAVITLAAHREFKSCLATIVATSPELSRRVLAIDGSNSHAEFTETQGAMHTLWQQHGLVEALNEVYQAGATGEHFDRFLRGCSALTRTDDSAVNE